MSDIYVESHLTGTHHLDIQTHTHSRLLYPAAKVIGEHTFTLESHPLQIAGNVSIESSSWVHASDRPACVNLTTSSRVDAACPKVRRAPLIE